MQECIFHLDVGSGSVDKGQSAGAKLAYILREGKFSARTDLVDIGHGNLPAWANDDPRVYFAAADLHARSNARLFHEIEFALPLELTHQQQLELLEAYSKHVSNVPGVGYMPYAWGRQDTGGNPHVHLALSTSIHDGFDRDPITWWKNKARAGKPPELGGAPKLLHAKKEDAAAWVNSLRQAWADHCNAAFQRYGVSAFVDHRSHAARGLLEKPTKHVGWRPRAPGPGATRDQVAKYEGRMARQAEIEQYNAEVRDHNAVIARLRLAAQALEQPITIEEIAADLDREERGEIWTVSLVPGPAERAAQVTQAAEAARRAKQLAAEQRQAERLAVELARTAAIQQLAGCLTNVAVEKANRERLAFERSVAAARQLAAERAEAERRDLERHRAHRDMQIAQLEAERRDREYLEDRRRLKEEQDRRDIARHLFVTVEELGPMIDRLKNPQGPRLTGVDGRPAKPIEKLSAKQVAVPLEQHIYRDWLVYTLDGRQAIVDQGQVLHVALSDPQTLAAAVQIALLKWSTVRLQGDAKFQRLVLQEAIRVGQGHRIAPSLHELQRFVPPAPAPTKPVAPMRPTISAKAEIAAVDAYVAADVAERNFGRQDALARALRLHLERRSDAELVVIQQCSSWPPAEGELDPTIAARLARLANELIAIASSRATARSTHQHLASASLVVINQRARIAASEQPRHPKSPQHRLAEENSHDDQLPGDRNATARPKG